jgi:hypothetical protein
MIITTPLRLITRHLGQRFLIDVLTRIFHLVSLCFEMDRKL